ncbi:MAG: hypothetical protein ACAI34_17215 [Verrucomicrobium sp.]
MKFSLLVLAAGVLASGSLAAEPEGTSPLIKLTTIYGDTYQNCRVLKVTPETVTVMHQQGVTKIGLELLPADLQKKFNYDPARAREYAATERVKQELAQARAQELKEKRDRAEEARMAALLAEEKRLLEVAAQREKAIAEAAAPARPLGPMPGDPTPALGSAQPAPVMLPTEELVPVTAPITQIYTPGQNQSYRYLQRNSGYTIPWYGGGYGGYGYGYDFGYGYGYGYRYSQPRFSTPCPPLAPMPRRAPVSGTFRVGNGVIRINR